MLSLNLCFAREVLWNNGLGASAPSRHTSCCLQRTDFLLPFLLFCFLVSRFPPGLLLTVSAQWPMPPLIFWHPEACSAFSSWPLPSHSYSSAASRALCTVTVSEQNMVAAMCIKRSSGWWDQEAWQPVGHVLSWSKVLGVCSHPTGKPVPKEHDII